MICDGDFNLDLIKYNSSNAITDHINCLLGCGCVSLINKPTRFSTNCVPSLLDHIYTNIIDEQKSMMLASLFLTYLIICLFL